MKKIERSRYAILRELTDAALEEAVTAYMNDGWKPVGEIALFRIMPKSFPIFCSSIIGL